MTIHLFTVFPEAQRTTTGVQGFQPLYTDTGSQWESYTAIRNFFQNNAADENAWYGFFLPDFTQQSGLENEDVIAFIEANPGVDAYAFFPDAREAAAFLNVFEAGECAAPGILPLMASYLEQVGLDMNLQTWASHAQTSAHVNYIVAKPLFWMTWFDLAEKLYAMAAAENTPFALAANAGTSTVPYAVKSLMIDRLASLVLALDPALTLAVYDALQMPRAIGMPDDEKEYITVLNALKAAYIETGDNERLEQFYAIRNQYLTKEILAQSVRAPQKQVPVATGNPSLFYACITHVPLPITFPSYVTPVYLGQSQGPDRLNLRDLAPEWERYHPIIGGMAGNFALKNYLLKYHPDVKRIGLSMYRKFISRARISGVAAEDNWMMDVISDSDLKKQTIDEMMAPGDAPFLIGKTCGFVVGGQEAGYLRHYLHAHHGEDLLRFAAAAVELGVLDKTEIEAFFNEKVFLIGGIELGVFPAAFWLKAVSDIEKIVWQCVHKFPDIREGYQKRSWAFCAERLGSYLVLKHVNTHYRAQGGHGHFAGQLNLITQNDDVLYVPSL